MNGSYADGKELKLNQLGERNIIDEIFSALSISQEKDDCAVLRNGRDFLLLSTDIIRQSTHIPEGADPSLIGSFVANINLSDIAAMAGIPRGMLVSYLINPDSDDAYLRKIAESIDKELKKHGAEVLGGDTKEGDELVISGAIIGSQTGKLLRRRSDIRKHHIIGITNSLGRSAAGYIFNRSGYRKDLGTRMMLDVHARVREAQIMSEHGAKFMMDLSDGLFASMFQMKHDYGIGFKIVEDEIKFDRNVRKAAEISGLSSTEIACSFGGDYELFFSIENSSYRDFISAMESEKISVSFIGEAWNGDNIIFNGKEWSSVRNRGYEHFLGKPLQF